jgi:hypothetical protein
LTSLVRLVSGWFVTVLGIAVIAAGSTVVGPQRPAPAAPATGSIRGRVVTDDGQPIVNVDVRVARRAGSDAGSRIAATDETGGFIVNDLYPGSYSIYVNAPGYTYPDLPDPTPTTPSTYRPGDFATITMMRGGVITGTVTNESGEPVVAIGITAILVRDHNNKPVRPVPAPYQRNTDDRGVYRIYGLRPGRYIVRAGGGSQPPMSGYRAFVPTYHPSSARETAVEVAVRRGEESTGIDITFRSDRGHVLSGTVSGSAAGITRPVAVTLVDASIDFQQAIDNQMLTGESSSFAIYGVPDGEYDIQARSGWSTDESAASKKVRIKVKGADVGGIQLTLARLALVKGVLLIDTPTENLSSCEKKTSSWPESTIIRLRRDEEAGSDELPFLRAASARSDEPAFVIRDLEPGRYYADVRFPFDPDWYVRSVGVATSVVPTPRLATGKAMPSLSDFGRNGLSLTAGQRIEGVTVMIARGAAEVTGHVLVPKSLRNSTDVRLCLVPLSREHQNDPLRYVETRVKLETGGFALASIPPGQYWIAVVGATQATAAKPLDLPLVLTDRGRARVRSQAEAAKMMIDLRPCQRVKEYEVKYPDAPANR